MTGAVFLVQDNGELVEMTEQAYDSEDMLQKLLADHPSLIAGDQVGGGSPIRLLLISREAAVPSEEEGGGRWSLDHLFLDQDAIPTLVEVKRSTDTRIRREVVGQMLDYAANAVVYWPLDRIRSQFEATCEHANQSAEQVLAEFLGDDVDQEEFWQKTKTNLQAGRVRLLFVADEIPPELRRVVEFLNSQMDPAEVLAVEVKQYVGPEMKTLVPRVIGQTAGAQLRKTGARREKRQWDEASYFAELESRRGKAEAEVGTRILGWAKENALRISWGQGTQDGSFSPKCDHKDVSHHLVTVWTGGVVTVQSGSMQKQPPFDDESMLMELLRRLNEIPGVALPDHSLGGWPGILLSTFQDEAALTKLLDALGWAIGEIRAS
jgi:hypothetical protein